MNFTIRNEDLAILSGSNTQEFPKYTSQLINWANQNAQGTRPKMVGQLSELFPQFMKESEIRSLNEWRRWYLEHYPYAIENATDKIYFQVEKLKEAIQLVDRDLVRRWVEDLVITKTYTGLYVQEAILSKIADILSETYRLATPDEESQGIDGYVGQIPYSIKPDSYKTMDRLSEEIDVKMVYYTKKKTGLSVEVQD